MEELSAKEKIIETTRKMIEEEGYNNLNVNKIAKEAGVAIGTLYWHFKRGKPSILKEIVRKGYTDFLDDSILENINKDSFSKFIREFINKYIKQHQENRRLIIAVEYALLENQTLFEDVDYIRDELKLIDTVSKVIKKIDGDNKKDIYSLSKFIIYSLDCIVHRQVIYGDIVEDIDDLTDYLLEFVLKFINH
ncbi:MAG: TetR/AcrR family transcriptional regulator [Promethearchaeota archaeon]|nr:MAG: TetR/AcrR family transcriptional regulator [Candidatus Lokiarchaeota archaeon]